MNMLRRPGLVMALSLTGAVVAFSLAGPLDPPAGPVASTPGPEPRTPMNQQTTPGDTLNAFVSVFKIQQSGSYYLTGDVVQSASGFGIVIDASDVTLDLSGFTVRGGVAASSGIRVRIGRSNVTIRNGRVVGWPQNGIWCEESGPLFTRVRIEDVQVSQNGFSGIVGARFSDIRRCTAAQNGQDGFNVLESSIVEDCISTTNGRYGFSIGNGGGTLLARCVASYNSSDGFNNGPGLVSSPGASFVDCVANANSGEGFDVTGAMLRGCVAARNGGTGIQCVAGSRVTDCQANANALSGIDAGLASMVMNCSVYNNVTGGGTTHFGIRLSGSGARAVGNLASNTFNGLGVTVTGTNCTVMGNTVANNSIGYSLASNANAILMGNTASANGANNYVVNGGNDTAAIITNPGANFSTTNTAANFVY